jgi:hypothetical protein
MAVLGMDLLSLISERVQEKVEMHPIDCRAIPRITVLNTYHSQDYVTGIELRVQGADSIVGWNSQY